MVLINVFEDAWEDYSLYAKRILSVNLWFSSQVVWGRPALPGRREKMHHDTEDHIQL